MRSSARAAHAAFLTLAFGATAISSLAASHPVMAATITQSAGCFSPVTSTWSTFPLSVSASPSPSSVNAGDTITVSGTELVVTVSSTLVAAGVGAGVVSPGANSVASTVKLSLTGTNTTQGTQVPTGTANLNFDVSVDGVSGAVTVVPDPVVGTVALSDTTWTAPGGNVTFAVPPGTPPAGANPTLAERNAAPIQILNKLNGTLNANFYCWPGAANAAGNGLVPGASTEIATVTVTGGTTTTTSSTTTTTTSSTTTTTTGSTTTTTAGGNTTPTTLPGPRTATGNYAATCSNSITPDKSALTFHVTGTVPGSVVAGGQVTLTDQSWKVDVPGSVLDAGVALGLLNEGDMVSAAVTAGLFASNTAEGNRAVGPINLTLGPIALDPVTGESDDVSTTFAVPDITWTAVGGTVSYEMATTSMEVTIGALKVKFTCTPNVPVTPFVTTNVTGATATPPAPKADVLAAQASSTTTTAAPAPTALATTGGIPVGELAAGLALVDIGYLVASAARPPRRRQRLVATG